jgi:hypothetical protein
MRHAGKTTPDITTLIIQKTEVCEYYKYMLQDNMKHDGGKPTQGVATPIVPTSAIPEHGIHEPQVHM